MAASGNELVPFGDETPHGESPHTLQITRHNRDSATCSWTITPFAVGKLGKRTLWSQYFSVGNYDWRLLVYPTGDSQSLPGYISLYVQVTDPRGASSNGKWDCFASYRLALVHPSSEAKTIARDSWHRFSGKKKSHGWCDFAPVAAVTDGHQGFTVNDTVVVSADILVLNESVSFTREAELAGSASTAIVPVGVTSSDAGTSGRFTWRVHNFPLFRDMIKAQKIMSPVFTAGECSLRLSVYQSSVGTVDYMSMCLESKDTDRSGLNERTCWLLFRMSVLNQLTGGKHRYRDSYGRFAADSKSGDNTSLGWNDFMPVSEFLDPELGYTVDDTAVFSASFHIIKESTNFVRNLDRNSSALKRNKSKSGNSGDGYSGRFVWRIENFTRLKDLLKKRKITALCIKSRHFQIGNRDCRLIVYPRGQSQPPNHLSMFLEVTDPRMGGTEWSCFVSHRLTVVNQKTEDRAVAKESQNRYSRAAKDWGWREFVTLTSLFDQDAGFLVNDTVIFSAEVLVLKESTEVQEVAVAPLTLADEKAEALALPPPEAAHPPMGTSLSTCPPPAVPPADRSAGPAAQGRKIMFTWRIENFVAFKEIMETRKIFSRYFAAGPCELRLGVYESFDTLCIYLESDALVGDPERNFWVKYRIAVLNQKRPARTEWKESAICTKSWNNSVLQFVKVSDMCDPEAGFLHKDGVVLACEILDCCPWFEFADLDTYVSDEDGEGLSTAADSALDSDDDSGLDDTSSGGEEEVLRAMLARAGIQLGAGNSPPVLFDTIASTQATLRNKVVADPEAAATLLEGLREYVRDTFRVRRLLQPTSTPVGRAQGSAPAGTAAAMAANAPMLPFIEGAQTGPSVLSVLMGVKSLQHSLIDLLMDIMVAACQNAKKVEMGLLLPLDRPARPPAPAAKRERDGRAAQSHSRTHSHSHLHGDGCCSGHGPGSGHVHGHSHGQGHGHGHGHGHSHGAGVQQQMQDQRAGDSAADCSSSGPVDPGLARQLSIDDASAAAPSLATAPSGSLGEERGPTSDGPAAPQTPPATPVPHKGSNGLTAAVGGGGASSSSTADAALSAGTPCSSAANSVAANDTPRPELQDPEPSSSDAASATPMQHTQHPRPPPAAEQGPPSPLACTAADAAEAAAAGSCYVADSTDGSASADSGALAEADVVAQRGSGDSEATAVPTTVAAAATDAAADAAALSSGGGSSHTSDVSALTAEAGSLEDGGSAVTVITEEGASPNDIWPATEEVLQQVVGWLASLETDVCQGRSPAPDTAAVRSRLHLSVHKVAALLAVVPRALQAEVVMLVPKLVEVGEHTAAAGALLGRLAEAAREGPDMEAALRMPVLAALGRLCIDPAVAEKVLRAALEALPMLSEAELPPAVGLVLKLASESPTARVPAVQCVRARVRSATPGVAGGTLDAMRLAVLQHREVAAAVLADIDADARGSRASPDGRDDGGEGTTAAAPAGSAVGAGADVEVLLDLLTVADLRAEAERVLERCVLKGLVTSSGTAAALERRAAARTAADSAAARSPTQQPQWQPSGFAPYDALFASSELASGNGHYAMLTASDDFAEVLPVAETMLCARNEAVRGYAAGLYAALFHLHGGQQAKRARLLRGLVGQATAVVLPPEPTAQVPDAPTPAPAASSKPSGGRKAKAAAKAAAAAAAAAAKTQATAMAEAAANDARCDISGADAAQEMLLAVVEGHPERLQDAMQLLLRTAQSHAQEAEQLRRQARADRQEADRAAAAAAAGEQRVTTQLRSAEERVAEGAAALQREKADRKADSAAFAEERRDAQGKLRDMERQMEWVRAERDELAAASQGAASDLAARLKDSEQAVTRLKAARREDTKRLQREKATAAERVKEARAAAQRVADDAASSGVAAAAAAKADSGHEDRLKALEAHLAAEKAAAVERAEEVARCKMHIDTVEAQLSVHQKYINDLEDKLNPLMGLNLQQLSPAGLDALARSHEAGLRRVREIQKQRHEEGAHAAATSVVSSLGALGSPSGSMDSLTSLSTTSTGPHPPLAANQAGMRSHLRSRPPPAPVQHPSVGSASSRPSSRGPATAAAVSQASAGQTAPAPLRAASPATAVPSSPDSSDPSPSNGLGAPMPDGSVSGDGGGGRTSTPNVAPAAPAHGGSNTGSAANGFQQSAAPGPGSAPIGMSNGGFPGGHGPPGFPAGPRMGGPQQQQQQQAQQQQYHFQQLQQNAQFPGGVQPQQQQQQHQHFGGPPLHAHQPHFGPGRLGGFPPRGGFGPGMQPGMGGAPAGSMPGPPGLPNGLLSGTGLLNGHHRNNSTGNHQLW